MTHQDEDTWYPSFIREVDDIKETLLKVRDNNSWYITKIQLEYIEHIQLRIEIDLNWLLYSLVQWGQT